MPNTSLFSNKPQFCQQNFTTNEALSLQFISDAVLNPNAEASFAKCGDPLLGTLAYKNVVHHLIRCGGKAIDVNWMEDMFPMRNPTQVSTKRFFNRFMCDPDLNIYVANNAEAASAGVPFWVTINKSNHGSNGSASMAAVGFGFVDKDNQIEYTITDADTSVPFAHRFELTPHDENITGFVRANTPYLISAARYVGGCSCPEDTNSFTSLGYAQEVNFLRLRRDWRLCVDILSGYEDKLQYAITYDMQGNPVDSWDVKEAQDMRLGIRMALNKAAFIGTPITNPRLVSDAGATIDGVHTGFYGLIPTLKYGGGVVYDYAPDRGFDLEVDLEPILLYQDSLKRSQDFMVMHGKQFRFNIIDRANKMVSRQDVGNNMWEAYRRMGDTIEKLGFDKYKYQGAELDFKLIDSWSDTRYMGSDYYSNMAIFMSKAGADENGRAVQPIEFYQYGVGNWTGAYQEFFVDERKTTRCDYISGWASQSIAMDVKCPNMHILINPVNG